MTDTPAPRFKALSLLENEHAPLLRRRAPYWRPRPAACFRDVYTPSFDWTHPDWTPELGFDLSVLDRNGAFVSAASSATFAHGALEHTGPLPEFAKAAGYYRITAHSWALADRIVSPLGGPDIEGKVWVAHPTVEQLAQLVASGHWPDVTIHDSWTCPDSVRFREWATAVNAARVEALRAVQADPDHDPAESPGSTHCPCSACPWYKAVKDGYAVAVQMFLGQSADGSVKSGVKRPDWYHTIHAQHAATTWRYVWKGLLAGFEPVQITGTDEVVHPTVAVAELHERGLIKMDESGAALGTFKTKEIIRAAAAAA